MEGVGGLKLLKTHKNVSALPLLGKCAFEKPLLQILVPPALHIKLGVVNDALEQLDKRWEGLERWFGERGISYVPYHGCVLGGKECSQVLDDVDSLEESLPETRLFIPAGFQGCNGLNMWDSSWAFLGGRQRRLQGAVFGSPTAIWSEGNSKDPHHIGTHS